jgi:cell division protein FtsB
MGNIRDLEQNHPHQSLEQITAENTTLKHQVHQLTQDNRILEERLHAARSTLRFQDRRLADLEAKQLDDANQQ